MTYVNLTDFTANGELEKAISVYADAARADKALVLSTGMIGSDARITDSGEGFTGTLRWLEYGDGADGAKPSTGAATYTDLDSGVYMDMDAFVEVYVKNVDVTAARENSIQSLISKVDGLSYLGRQFGAVRARKEDRNLRSVLQGVSNLIWSSFPATAKSESADAGQIVATPANGVVTDAGSFGYVTAYTYNSDAALDSYAPLFANDSSAPNTQSARSDFFDALLDAMTAVSGEFEEAFYYLIVSPATFNILRKQNILDASPVQDGNLVINSLLGGKIRLIVSGNANTTVEDNQATANTLTTSYLVKPSAVHYSNVAVNNPTAIDTNVVTNRGFGDVSIVSRWGNIIHPRGYTSTATTFPTNTTLSGAAGWTRVAKNVNQTGIFPIFHG